MKYLLSILFVIGALSVDAQRSTVVIETSAICGQCKDRIEEHMRFAKGVKLAELDLDSKKLTVVYNAGKTSPETLRNEVSSIGYKADNVEPVETAYHELPACCRKEGVCTHGGQEHKEE